MRAQPFTSLQSALLAFSLLAVLATVIGIAIATAPGLG
jgi:hypothetical protein